MIGLQRLDARNAPFERESLAHASPFEAPKPAKGGAPVQFAACAGFYHGARGDVAVLMCSPWGYEELCARASWRMLADALAAADFPVLRFDYPGVGDSLGASLDGWRLADWVGAARTGVALLREWSGARRLVVLGQGLGAGVALVAAGQCDAVAGVVSLAGFSSGRLAMRELFASAPMLASSAGLAHRPAGDGGLNLLGFELPASLVADFKALDFTALTTAPALRLLSVQRPNRANESKLAEHFARLGVEVTHVDYVGYESLVANPTIAAYPQETFARVIDTLVEWRGFALRRSQRPPRLPDAVLETQEFREDIVRFGANGNLGVYCRPNTSWSAQAYLFLNCGANPHTGARRMTVEHARFLAKHGVASFRIDTAGVGDSPARDARHPIYRESQIAETSEAVDWLKLRGAQKITLFGVCSGAYQAAQAAARDQRIDAIIIANPFLFVMDENCNVDELIHFYSRSNAEYFRRLTNRDGLRKVLRGTAPVSRLARVVFSRLRDRFWTAMPSFVPRSLGVPRYKETMRLFEKLDAQRTQVTLVTAEGDLSEDEMTKYFGRQDAGLARFKNVTRVRLRGADHSLTTPDSDAWLRRHFLERAGLC